MRGIMAGLVFHHLAMPISQYELKAKRMPANAGNYNLRSLK